MKKIEIKLESQKYKKKARAAVIMTSYGRDTLLERAIQSVLDQRMGDFILLIIDDNSSVVNPKTRGIIQKFDKLDKRITFFSTSTTNKHRRKVSTFAQNINFMLRYAYRSLNVAYISYIPCDDLYYPNRLEQAVNYLDTHEVATSCWNPIFLVDGRRRKVSKIPAQRSVGAIRHPIAVLDHNCVTHRLGVIKHMPYPYWPIAKHTEHGAPDGEFFTKLVAYGGPIYHAGNDPTGEKTRHGDSIQGRIHGW